MDRLLSVNVGLPRDIEWRGRTVHTGIWKNPVHGCCRVGRLNLGGDGQGDLGGHGGDSEPSSSTRSNRIATGRSC
jgi:MOSC domain-containing protein YiiM